MHKPTLKARVAISFLMVMISLTSWAGVSSDFEIIDNYWAVNQSKHAACAVILNTGRRIEVEPSQALLVEVALPSTPSVIFKYPDGFSSWSDQFIIFSDTWSTSDFTSDEVRSKEFHSALRRLAEASSVLRHTPSDLITDELNRSYQKLYDSVATFYRSNRHLHKTPEAAYLGVMTFALANRVISEIQNATTNREVLFQLETFTDDDDENLFAIKNNPTWNALFFEALIPQALSRLNQIWISEKSKNPKDPVRDLQYFSSASDLIKRAKRLRSPIPSNSTERIIFANATNFMARFESHADWKELRSTWAPPSHSP